MSINHLCNPNIEPKLDLYVNSVTSETPIDGGSTSYWENNGNVYQNPSNLLITKYGTLEVTEYRSQSLVRIRGSGLIRTFNLVNGSTTEFGINTTSLGYKTVDADYVYVDIQNKTPAFQGGKNVSSKLYHRETLFYNQQDGLRFIFELPVIDDRGVYNDLSAVFNFDVIIKTIF